MNDFYITYYAVLKQVEQISSEESKSSLASAAQCASSQ